MNYLDQSTNQNDGLAGRCKGLFPPHLQKSSYAIVNQRREKVLFFILADTAPNFIERNEDTFLNFY